MKNALFASHRLFPSVRFHCHVSLRTPPAPPQVSAACSWDSSIHDSAHLNRITSANERIYLIVKATVQLSHPACMELVLRKRIAVNIYNKQVGRGVAQSWTQSWTPRVNSVAAVPYRASLRV